MPDILVTENVGGDDIERLGRKFEVVIEPDLWKSPALLRDRVAACRAIVVRNQTKVTADVIAAGRRLEVIARAGAGLENVDTFAAAGAGVVACYAPCQNSISVAELTLGLMLALARAIPAADCSTKGGGWERQRFTGTELYGKTLGVIGLGRIGYLTAARARAFGMEIVAHDPGLDADAFTVMELRARLLTFEEALAASDFVSCHAPDVAATRGMFDDEAFASMKDGAYFINAARGSAVDEQALARALKSGKLAGAALDVRTTEPPERGPLEGMENVILMPHVAAFTREGQDRVVAAICRDVEAVLGGGAARNALGAARPAGRDTSPPVRRAG